MDSGVSSRWEDAVNVASSEEVIYCDRHKLFLKSKGKEDRSKFLNLTISLETLIGPVSEKSVAVKITDEEDPFVYYILIINESDFLSIKEQQGLLIDYDKFPQQLIKLFDLCKHGDVSPWKYHLLLEELTPEPFGSCKITLKVIETNQFKQLCHLSLAIHVGTDSEIKRHLALQMSMLKDSLNQAEARANQAEFQIQEVVKKLETKGKELEDVQVRWREESNIYHQQARLELNAERDNFMKIQLELKNSFESEKKQLQDLLDEKKKSFDNVLGNLQAENKALFEKSCEMESKLRETTQQLNNAQEEIDCLQKDKEKLCTKGFKLDADFHDKEKSLNVLKTRSAVLEQELRDKNALLDQQKRLLHVAHEQKVFLQSSLAAKDGSLQKKLTSLRALSRELCKANEIIQKLSKEVCLAKSQLKNGTVAMSEQEQLLHSKEKELVDLKTKVEDSVKIISTLELSEQKLKKDIEAAETKIVEKDTALSNNNNLINWLNRRINELQTFTPKEMGKEQRLPNSAMTLTSTPHLPAYLQVTKRVFETTGSSGDRSSASTEIPINQKTNATPSQILAVTTQSNNYISPPQTYMTKLSTESHETPGLERIDEIGIQQLMRLAITCPRPNVAKVSAAPVNPSTDLRFQTVHPHVPGGSSNVSPSNEHPETNRKRSSPFQYFTRQ